MAIKSTCININNTHVFVMNINPRQQKRLGGLKQIHIHVITKQSNLTYALSFLST